MKQLQSELNGLEAKRLSNMDVFGVLDYQPTERQEVFHNATEYDVLYGGAAGGG